MLILAVFRLLVNFDHPGAAATLIQQLTEPERIMMAPD
jgi:hypothetical protein